jgi:hypothetical protein
VCRARGGVWERAAALSKRETYGHKYTQSNRELWDEWAVINARSSFYNVQGFKAGRCTLRPIELEALGDVTDKTLLHLQCHFGMDTHSRGPDVGPTSLGSIFPSKPLPWHVR